MISVYDKKYIFQQNNNSIYNVKWTLMYHKMNRSSQSSVCDLNSFVIGAMKLLGGVQRLYQLLGLVPQNNHSHFNVKNMLIIFIMVQGGISSAAYFMFQSETIIDYGNSFYFWSLYVGTVTYYSIIVANVAKLFQLIEKLQEIIEKSEL